MPKQRITKEMVIDAAFALTREKGLARAGVTEIAARAGCSVQPIYSYLGGMEGLRRAVCQRTREFVQSYVAARLDPEVFFRSIGMAYAALAREEPHLFQTFMMHPREDIASLEDLYAREASPEAAAAIARQYQTDEASARRLHMHMLIYTTGIGAILATASPGIPQAQIQAQLEQAFEAFFTAIIKRKEEA